MKRAYLEDLNIEVIVGTMQLQDDPIYPGILLRRKMENGYVCLLLQDMDGRYDFRDLLVPPTLDPQATDFLLFDAPNAIERTKTLLQLDHREKGQLDALSYVVNRYLDKHTT